MRNHRNKIYNQLKELGLGAKATQYFGVNFTNVSSNKLTKFIEQYKANLKAKNELDLWEAANADQSCCKKAEEAAAKAVKSCEAYENKEAEKKAAEAVWTHEPAHSSRWYEDMLAKMKEKGLIRNIDELKAFFKKSEPEPRKYDIQEILDRLDTIICLLRNRH